jgi:DNA transformation protein and related proteins
MAGGTSDPFCEFVLDQLRGLPAVRARRMFGGHGLYAADRFFGIVHAERLYLKTDEASRAAYRADGMAAFQPNARQTLHSYYEVPPEVLEDAATLKRWALEAVRCAGSAAPRAARSNGARRVGARRGSRDRCYPLTGSLLCVGICQHIASHI